MPRPAPVRKTTAAVASADGESTIRFSMRNLAFLGAGLASVVLGFVLLAGGSTVGAPLLLVLGYAVLIPLGIIL